MNDNTTATKYVLSMPLDARFVPVLPDMAKQIGLKESIVLGQLSIWLKGSSHIHEGKYWIYKCLREWHEAIPYLGEETIRRTILSLKAQGYILVGNFNEKSYDNTQWFTLEPDKCSSLLDVYVNAITTPAQNEPQGETTSKVGGAAQNGATIPESLIQYKESSTLSTAAQVERDLDEPEEVDLFGVIPKTEPMRNTHKPAKVLNLASEPNLPATPYKAIVAEAVEEVVPVDDPKGKPKKERKPRKPDLEREAIVKAFGIAPTAYGQLGCLKGMLFGTANCKGDWEASQLEPPATIEEVEKFGVYAKKRALEKKITIPSVPAKIQLWFEDFRSQQVRLSANKSSYPAGYIPIEERTSVLDGIQLI